MPVVNFLGAGTQPDGDEEGDGKAQDGDLSETVETIGREGIVTHNDVNLRAGPAKRYDILLVKQKGDSVFVRHAQTGEDGAAWYCVENGEALCYVMAEFVELLPEAEAQGGAERRTNRRTSLLSRPSYLPPKPGIGGTATLSANITGQAPEGLIWRGRYPQTARTGRILEGAAGPQYVLQAGAETFLSQYRVTGTGAAGGCGARAVRSCAADPAGRGGRRILESRRFGHP